MGVRKDGDDKDDDDKDDDDKKDNNGEVAGDEDDDGDVRPWWPIRSGREVVDVAGSCGKLRGVVTAVGDGADISLTRNKTSRQTREIRIYFF